MTGRKEFGRKEKRKGVGGETYARGREATLRARTNLSRFAPPSALRGEVSARQAEKASRKEVTTAL